MRVGRRHVLHASVLIAVGLQLGFAAAFLVDAAQTNSSYDALAAHRVEVSGQVRGCAFVGTSSRSLSFPRQICKVGYSYQGQAFTAYMPYGQPTTLMVDPRDTSVRMSKVTFDNGPVETTGDIVIAALLLFGAVVVTTVHQVHLYRYRRRRSHRVARSDPVAR